MTKDRARRRARSRIRPFGRRFFARHVAGAALAAAATLPFGVGPAQGESRLLVANLVDLTLEQLSNIEVTSVSKHAQRLVDAAASVFVITAEDIRRAGAVTLPDALRLAPNLQVARADTNQYAISARGFSSVLANKMLVLIDGRTAYSPLFSGVFWEAQDLVLEDVERIEVISGPGGTLWGSNAVNGVINVITRPARNTQGALVAAGSGSMETSGVLRYGGRLGQDEDSVHFRLYGKYLKQRHSESGSGSPLRDASERTQAGFRADWGGASQNFTVQGDAYTSDVDQGLSPEVRRLKGVNLLGRWSRELGADANLRAQLYYDKTEREQPGAIHEELETFDAEFQHGFRIASEHSVLWGASFRHQVDYVVNLNPAALAFLPASRNLNLGALFVQGQFTVARGLNLTAGIKAEHNDFTHWEHLPSARLAWKVADDQLLWGAASRAVRAPSRVDRELYSPGQAPSFVLAGGPNFVSEIANVYEIGYRAQPNSALNWSITAYHHDFDRLRSLEPAPAGPVFDNKIDGTIDGVEAWGAYRLTDTWRMRAGFVRQRERLQPKPGSAAIGGVSGLGNDPDHWWTVGTSFDIGPGMEIDLTARRVGALPNPAVPGYTAVDARFGWRLRPDLELSLTAKNLFDPRHPEWGAAPGRAEFQREVYFKLVWRM